MRSRTAVLSIFVAATAFSTMGWTATVQGQASGGKIAGGSGKAIVKNFARTQLPASIVDRRKSGFGVPLASWFRAADGLGAMLASLPERKGADVFDPETLNRKIDEHRSGACDHSELLWTALNLVTWREAFGV